MCSGLVAPVRTAFSSAANALQPGSISTSRGTSEKSNPGEFSAKLEKVLYDSLPDFPIPANLYIPAAAKPPLPGVLFQMGHNTNGKGAVPYQRCCQGLVQLGYVVLAFDPSGARAAVSTKGGGNAGEPKKKPEFVRALVALPAYAGKEAELNKKKIGELKKLWEAQQNTAGAPVANEVPTASDETATTDDEAVT